MVTFPLIELVLLTGAILFGILCWRYHISYQLSFGLGIALLVSAGLIIAIGREDLANTIALLAYFLMVAGLSLALLEYRKELKESEREKPVEQLMVRDTLTTRMKRL